MTSRLKWGVSGPHEVADKPSGPSLDAPCLTGADGLSAQPEVKRAIATAAIVAPCARRGGLVETVLKEGIATVLNCMGRSSLRMRAASLARATGRFAAR